MYNVHCTYIHAVVRWDVAIQGDQSRCDAEPQVAEPHGRVVSCLGESYRDNAGAYRRRISRELCRIHSPELNSLRTTSLFKLFGLHFFSVSGYMF